MNPSNITRCKAPGPAGMLSITLATEHRRRDHSTRRQNGHRGREAATRSAQQVCVFFFSSRRRHTRFDCDWSSDVCSSDLCVRQLAIDTKLGGIPLSQLLKRPDFGIPNLPEEVRTLAPAEIWETIATDVKYEIGRASCRERV